MNNCTKKLLNEVLHELITLNHLIVTDVEDEKDYINKKLTWKVDLDNLIEKVKSVVEKG